jgi:hypothetical protein
MTRIDSLDLTDNDSDNNDSDNNDSDNNDSDNNDYFHKKVAEILKDK